MFKNLLAASLLLLSPTHFQVEASRQDEVTEFLSLVGPVEAWAVNFEGCYGGLIRRYYTRGSDAVQAECAVFKAIQDNIEKGGDNLDEIAVESHLCGDEYNSETWHNELCSQANSEETIEIINKTKRMNAIYEGLNTYSSDECKDETEQLQIDLKEYYDDSSLQETVLPEGTFVDYSTNVQNNEAYEAACRAVNGDYQEVHFDGLCDTIIEGVSQGFVKMMVAGHPRCYSKSCTAEDSHPLLRRWSLRETEDRNTAYTKNGGPRYICFGYVLDEPYESLCDFTTSSRLDSEIDLIVAREKVQPKVKSEKFLFLELSDKKSVDFPENVAEYETVCKEASKINVYTTLSASLTCSDGAGYNKEFQVSKFPTCLSQGCGSRGGEIDGRTIHYDSTDQINEVTLDAILKRFRDRMIGLELLQAEKNNVVCMSSGFVTSVSWTVAALFTVAATLWHL